MTPELKARFEEEIKQHKVVVYMKGTPLFPRCGFSAATVQALSQYGDIHAIDVLAEPEVRDGIKEYSSWPTIPQVYINGQFVGGCDIVRDLDARGELEKLIKGGS